MKQSIENIKSEIRFREKLARQHVDGEAVLDDYIAKADHDVLMRERVDTTYADMKRLQDNGVILDPFIELGAERGQRSLVLANDFKARGFALDISFAQLKTMGYWSQFFNKPVLPVRVCCNIYSLPFQGNSLNFAFCYQFLHHFPAPAPVIKEIHRVLAGGYFYFAEEPYKRYSLKLYRRKTSNKPGKLRKVLTYLESFIAHQYEVEEVHGIIENDEISLDQWLAALEIFAEKKVYLQSAASLLTSELGRVSALRIRLHRMLGGGIGALVKKTGAVNNTGETTDLYDLLGCPVCVIAPSGAGRDRASLVRHTDFFKCESCKTEYPIIEDVILLLPRPELKELYPQYVR
jgi:SAM-dependent methyltransferase/uncharacterized protein YbaR (Trm112 family)